MKIFKKREGEHISDNGCEKKANQSIENIEIYICLVCGEDMGKEKYACKNQREAYELKCINAGYVE